MRKEAVYTVLLNATLFKGMKCFIAQDPRYIRFSVFEGTAATHYNLRVRRLSLSTADHLIFGCAGADREDRRRAHRGDQLAHPWRVNCAHLH